ncbi:hypothetical protein INT43_006488 [Umbelopsis isabellina]|uniref:PH domain-like protein n=1 Tax=Mortierella isabellina TaxID=91625 RepID=A0A8H7Q035_MORIS|nr:hypothetical protein INT43_006488 [Umbelopsis isabellina]
MDLAARKAANLSVLRRQDPDIVDLLDQSSHAVVYSFDLSKAGWAKKGIEGTVFLIRRNTPPYYGIYILNRVSIDNYRLILTEDLVIEQQDEYIIYQTPNGTFSLSAPDDRDMDIDGPLYIQRIYVVYGFTNLEIARGYAAK